MNEKTIAKTVLFVEDGSVDTDELEKLFPDIPIIIYRQGSLKPEFKIMDTPVEYVKKSDTFTPNQIGLAFLKTFDDVCSVDYDPHCNDYTHTLTITNANKREFIDKVLAKLTGADSVEDN